MGRLVGAGRKTDEQKEIRDYEILRARSEAVGARRGSEFAIDSGRIFCVGHRRHPRERILAMRSLS